MQRKYRVALSWFTGVSAAALGATAPALAQPAPEASYEVVVTATGRQSALQDVPIAVTAISGDALANAGVTDLRQIEQLAPSYHFQSGQSNSAGTTAYIRGIGTGGDNPGFESAVGYFIDGVYRNRSGVALGELPEVRRIEVLRGPQGTLFGRNTSAGAISVVTAGADFTPQHYGELSYGERNLLGAKLGLNGPLIADKLAGRIDIAGVTQDGYIHDSVSGREINGKDRSSARAQLQFEITPTVSLRLIADVSQIDEECCGGVVVAAGPTVAVLNALSPGAVQLPVDAERRTMSITPGRDLSEKIDEQGYSGQLDWDLSFGSLTSITAYRDWKARRNMDIDFSSMDRAYRDGYRLGFETFTQELRLHGEAGKLDWLVGGFYLNEKLNLEDRIRFGAQSSLYADSLSVALSTNALPGLTTGGQIFGSFPQLSTQLATPGFRPNIIGSVYLLSQGVNLLTANATQRGTYDAISSTFAAARPTDGSGQQSDVWGADTESWSVFTHDIINLTDNLSLTLGARFNHEQKDMRANLLSTAASCDVLRSPTILPLVLGAQALTPLASSLATLACNPAINNLQNGAYADSTEENEWSGVASLAFKPNEDMMMFATYSRGYKAGGFNLDRSGFSLLATTTVKRTTNDLQFAPEFVDNFELGLKWRLFEGGTLNTTAFYEDISDYQINAFNGFNFLTFNAPKAVSRGVEVDLGLRPAKGFSLQGGVLWNEAYLDSVVTVGSETLPAGTTFAHAPEWALTGSATWEHNLTEKLTGLLYIDGRWNSEYKTQTLGRDPLGRTDNDSYALFNARVGVSHEAGWSLEAFVSNLTDKFYYVHGFAPPEQPGTYSVYPGAPRTVGVTLRAEF